MFDVTSKKKSNILWLILCVYIFLAFLNLPYGVGVGLDPSWQYAISRAALDKLAFGKDIIFTYGPLGYLIHGSVLEQNFYAIFLFRLIIESITFCISVLTIIYQTRNFQKLLIASSIFVAYLLGLPINGLSIDYKIIFAFIMVLSWDNIINKQNIRFWALAIGLISGFCLLGKFNIGVCILGISILVFLDKLFKDFKNKSNLSTSLFALSDVVIATLTTCFLVLNSNLLDNVRQLLFCVFIASFSAILAWFIHIKLLIKSSNDMNNTNNNFLVSDKDFFINSFYFAYILTFLIKTFYFSPLLINYLKGALEISSGYSSAMSIEGSNLELGFAVAALIMLLLILIQLMQEEFLGLGLASVFTLWMSFKHGYIRQDEHTYIFLECLPVIYSLASTKLKNRIKIFSLFKIITLIYLILFISIYWVSPSKFAKNSVNWTANIIHIFNPNNVINKISNLINPEKLRLNINNNSSLELSKVRLPEKVLKVLGNRTIDIIPWEISLVESNKLNWQPRPIFQSYSAYTKFLDSANFNSISSKSPDYIIYNFRAIDNRHPFFDEPATFSYIACNYKLSSELNEFINLPAIRDLIVLQKRDRNICSSSIETKELSLGWNQSTKVTNSSLVRASIKFEYSILGKIYKTIFRAPPVNISVDFKNGSRSSLRIIPENSENGIIISHMPLNDNQILSLFQGKWSQRVQSFHFSTVNPILYKQNIQVKLNGYQILDSSITTEDESIGISDLKGINFEREPTEEYIATLDSQQTNYGKKDTINLQGWIVLKSNPQQPVWILVTHGKENIPVAITKTGWHRYDVGEFYKNPSYNQSGWALSLSLDKFPGDYHILKTWVYDPMTKTAKQLKGKQDLEINQAY